MPPSFKAFPILYQIFLVVLKLEGKIKSKEGFLLIRKVDVCDDVSFDLFLRVLDIWV